MSRERSSEQKIAVFINTSLGTRLALSVPPSTTAALLIREVERAHFECFPSFGEIKVKGFMVKHKSCFYRIAPSVLLICAIGDSKGPCFLHARAVQVNTHCTTLECDAGGVECSVISDVERNSEQKCQVVEMECVLDEKTVEDCDGGHSGDDGCVNLENSASSIPAISKSTHEENCGSGDSSATRSVTDIIRRHYPATDTFTESPYLHENSENMITSKVYVVASPVAPDITPRSSSLFILKDTDLGQKSIESKRPNVGQRLLMASSKLGISPANQSPVVSMYRSKGRKYFGTDAQIKNPVFDMSESSG